MQVDIGNLAGAEPTPAAQSGRRREERSKAIGFWVAAGSDGFIAGPGLGGALVDAIDWQAVFRMHLPVAAVALAGLQLVPLVLASTRQIPPDRLTVEPSTHKSAS